MPNMLDDVLCRIRAKAPELRRRGIRHVSIFGSVARGDADADSDVDLAFEVEPGRSFSLIRIEEARLLLEDALDRPVDFGEVGSLRPQVRSAFDRDRVQVF